MNFPTPSRKSIVLAGRLVSTALVVSYVLKHVDWGGVGVALHQVNLLGLTAAIALQGGAIAAAAARWRALLSAQSVHLSWLQTVRLSLVGLFFNLFFLGTLGSETAKFIGVLRHAPERKGILILSLVQDRLVGLAGLLLLVTGSIAAERQRLWHDPAVRPLVLALPIAGAVLIGGALGLWALGGPDQASGPQPAQAWRASLSRIAREALPIAAIGPALLLSGIVHGLVLVSGQAAAWAMGLHLSLPEAGVIFGVAALVLSLPVTIAGLGVREGILIWLLALFGFGRTDLAVSLSVCLLSINLFWALVGGLAFYWPVGGVFISSQNPG
jgi:uncharacterized membrane protein YbhN (UPF0104 family)